MPKKNQSKSDKKVLPVNNRKKPLPESDPTLIQVVHKMHDKYMGTKDDKSMGTKDDKSIGIKGHKSIGIKGHKSIGTKRHK
jgi:hypothetical protein